MGGRPLDIVLFGATGFTGTLVAHYLANNAPPELRWAIAGRNRAKLESVRDAVGISDLPIRIADAHDEASLDALAADASVVCATAGPFSKHGRPLVRAAARHGTHYCDITGEPQFVRRSIEENHEEAARTGARIVHCCGYDSIPSDLGVHMLWDHAHRTTGRGLRWAKGFAGETKGGMSGGTLATIVNAMEEASRDRSVLRRVMDPHGLEPDRRERSRDPFEQDQRGVRWDADLERWTAPFMMTVINARIVRRSNALVPGHYGEAFRYAEAMSLMRGPKGLLFATGVTAALGGLAAALAFAPTRKLVAKTRLAQPGEGPSKETREKGYFKFRLVAETEAGAKIRGRVEGHGDPGYAATAKMLGESALCLALDGDRLPAGGGVLTPASAMGMTLVERLRAASMTFVIDD